MSPGSGTQEKAQLSENNQPRNKFTMAYAFLRKAQLSFPSAFLIANIMTMMTAFFNYYYNYDICILSDRYQQQKKNMIDVNRNKSRNNVSSISY